MDYFSNISNDWTRNIKIKIMLTNTFEKKKILIYGLGLSGNSCLKFLRKSNYIKVFDDNSLLINKKIKIFF